jgi:16S rRNA (uracil1498-N3)-methyltransferase
MISKLSRPPGEIALRLHRVHTAQRLQPGGEVRLDAAASHYLSRVLRVGRGTTLVLFNGDGMDYEAEVLEASRQSMLLRVDGSRPGLPESGLRITVTQAISRGERMDLTLQKCTELGVAAFRPLFSERVEVRLLGDKLARRMAHWQGVVVAACEQCGRAVVPEVLPALSLDEWLLGAGPELRLLLDPGAGQSLAKTALAAELELVVGPEGGFSDAELARICELGVVAVRLGPRVLRTETAGPAAVAVLQGRAGDLR